MYCYCSKKLIKGEVIVKKKIDLTQLSPEELAELSEKVRKLREKKI